MAQMPIPNDWNGDDYCCWSVQWPNSSQWFAILNGLLGLPLRGRFWDASTGNIRDTVESFLSTYLANFELREVIMACGDTGLQELAAAVRLLAQNQCCGDAPPSNGGIQIVITSTEGAITPIYGAEPPGSLTPGEVPPGYPGTVEEYDADKCRTAAAIVRGFISSLRNLSSIVWINTTGLIVVVLAAIVGIIALPAFLIPILIAAAIGTTGLNAALVALADGIEANFDEWVCSLYEADSTVQVLSFISDALDALIALIPAEGQLAIALKTIALVLMNTGTVNKLFNLSQGYGEAYDCSACAGNLRHQVSQNQDYSEWEVFDWGDELSSYSVPNYSGSTTGYLMVVSLDALYDLELTINGGTPFGSPEPNFRAGSGINGDNGGQSNVYNQVSYELNPVGVGNLTIASSSTFTVSIMPV